MWLLIGFLVGTMALTARSSSELIFPDLSKVLDSYSILSMEELKIRSRRDSISEKLVSFRADNRIFRLLLSPDDRIFSDDFKVYSHDGETARLVPINKGNFWRGVLQGESGSSVKAVFDEDEAIAAIYTDREVYHLEPARWHNLNQPERKLLFYRESKLNSSISNGKPSFCGTKSRRELPTNHTMEETPTQHGSHKSFTSSADSRSAFSTCPIALIADYRFFRTVGDEKVAYTVNYMISAIQRVDEIFRKTVWASAIEGIGLEVKAVMYYQQPGGPDFNQPQDGDWDVSKLLDAFGKENWSSYCLAHLFTHQDFSNGVIGLAYVGHPELREAGGVCSLVYEQYHHDYRYLNIALSSSLNWGRRLLTAEADIVVAHEIGHNFGSVHDDAPHCLPSETEGGKYIMYSQSVLGNKQNHRKFSPCSTESIAKVLQAKRHLCFKEWVSELCGNMKVEGSEECDPGLIDSHPCCEKCRLKKDAVCCDENSACCQNCTYAPTTLKCRSSFPDNCQGNSFCNGSSELCPERVLLNGTDCRDKGVCMSGTCIPFCESRGMISCFCSSGQDKCSLCCQVPGQACTPATLGIDKQRIPLSDGSPCAEGVCQEGICHKVTENIEDLILNLLRNFTVHRFAAFMKTNIVGTVLFFSLVLWIPLSCIVNRYDNNQNQENQLMKEWMEAKTQPSWNSSSNVVGKHKLASKKELSSKYRVRYS